MDYRDARYLAREQVRCQRAVLWEEAKGKLNAVLATQGYGPEAELLYPERTARYEDIKARFDAFIKSIEDDGLHE